MTELAPRMDALSIEAKRALLKQMLQDRLRQQAGPRPLSHGQRALWFLAQLAPDDSAYNIGLPIRIRSRLDRSALRRALQRLVERHPTLRTTYLQESGEPRQQVHSLAEPVLEEVDASGWSDSELLDAVQVLHDRPYDLEHGPSLRACLYLRAPDDALLFLGAHHINLDGWSAGILLRDLQHLYAAEQRGAQAALPPTRAYAGFVDWQAAMLAGPDGARLREYWQRQLAGAPPALEIPADRPRPLGPPTEGATCEFDLDADLLDGLRQLARAERTTLYAVVAAALMALLRSYTGEDDLVLGTLTVGRSQSDFEQSVGYFVNPVPLRTRVSNDPSFVALLGRVQDSLLGALAHQDYPFPLLVRDLGLEREAGRSPLFNVVFNLQKIDRVTPSTSSAGQELAMQVVPIRQAETQFDLVFDCFENVSQVRCAAKYRADLFDRSTIERLIGHLCTLLRGAVADPTRRISELTVELARGTAASGPEATAHPLGGEQPVSALLGELRRLEVKLSLEGDRLRVNAPAGVLTVELRERLKQHKPELIAILGQAQQTTSSDGQPLPRLARQAHMPLSFSQQRLWFIDQLEPGNSAYNIPMVLRLRGPLDLAALENSLGEVVRRHEALRTRFAVSGGHPVQVVDPPRPFELAQHDLRDQAPAPSLELALQLVEQEIARPFDLAHTPLLRARLYRLDEQDHLLACVAHHIAADGWSLGVFTREMSALYAAFSAGLPSPVPELPIQYVDFAGWQHSQMHADRMASQLRYWTRQLAGDLPILDLPTDRPRPAARSWAGRWLVTRLDKGLLDAARSFSRAEGVTLFMTLLAAFETLLSRTTGQQDIVVGTPVANRTRQETEGLIGCFINNLVLRTDLSGEPTFRQVLARVRATTLDGLANQDVPFEKLVEVLQPDRDRNRQPLFQVLFALQNVELEEPRLAGLQTEVVKLTGSRARNDLGFELYERPTGLELCVEYATELFDEATVRRLCSQFETLLRAAVASPAAPISSLPLIAPAERERVVVEWNRTALPYPTSTGVHELFEAQVARTPEATALVGDGHSLTYAELDGRANRLAHYLIECGLRTDDIVGVHLRRSPEMVVAVLAILKAGAAYLPLDPTFPNDRLAYMLEDARASLVVTDSSSHNLAASCAQTILLDVQAERIAQQPATRPARMPGGERMAYVLYTSGSTGRPKGVQVPHRGLVNFLASMRREPGLSDTDVLLSVTTLSFDIAGLELFLPLTVVARVELAPTEVAADGARLLQRLEGSGATIMQATPATWRLLLAAGWQGTPGLRVLCGGEALPAELARQLLARSVAVWNLYGPTETTIWSTVHRVQPADLEGGVPIGRPIANTRVYVLDARRQPVPVGVPGELYIGGDGVALGYLNRPDLTAERFVADPFSSEAGARLYRTGDRVRYRADGALEYLGRLDTQVKLRGYRIELGEIERVLEQAAEVRHAVAIIREDVPGDQRLVAYVVPAAPNAADGQRLREDLRHKLPAYMLPSAIVSLDALPLTPNGKIDRKALPAIQAAHSTAPGTHRVLPRTDAERAVASIWQDVLGVPHVGVTDNFFDLGGHSLLVVQVHTRLRAAFGTPLSVAEMFQLPTIEALANRLAPSPQADATPASSGRVAPALARGARVRNRIAAASQHTLERPS